MATRKFPDLFYNPISFIGAIIASVSFGMILFLMLIEWLWHSLPPYFGLITYILLPSVLIMGLLIIPIGGLFERRRRKKSTGAPASPFPRIDLNDQKQRAAFFLFSTGTMLLVFFTAVGGYHAFEFTDSVTFCGKICHKVMKPEYTTYLHSPHARVACVQCHVGPGAGWYVRSKLSGVYQVYATIFNKYPRPIPVPIKNLRPARETCEECHWPQAFQGERRITKSYFLQDVKNTPWNIDMLLKIGVSTSSQDRRPAVHWHVSNPVQYLTTDAGGQTIPWVRLVNPGGSPIVFISESNPPSKVLVKTAKLKTMDCMDCHNRPTHIIRSPAAGVNSVLASGQISSALPDIKQIAAQSLVPQYTSTHDALTKINSAIINYYREKYPQVVADKGRALQKAVEAVQRIYQNNFFPYMKVDWRVYPNNIGHLNTPGCFRCHDGQHKSHRGQVISNTCETCHIILSQGTAPSGKVKLSGVQFQHPTDIDDAWQTSRCSECHDGTQ